MSTRDTEYAHALRAAIRERLAGQTSVAQYLARCEYLAAVHDRMGDRARFAKERAAIEQEAQNGAPTETR